MGAWLGGAIGATPYALVGVVVAVAVAAGIGRRAVPYLALVLLAGASSWMAAARIEATLDAAVPTGSVEIVADLTTDPRTGRQGDVTFGVKPSAIRRGGEWVAWAGPRLVVRLDGHTDVAAGEMALISGRLTPGPAWVRGDPAAGVLVPTFVERLDDGSALMAAGNLVRSRVRRGLARWWPEPAAVLVAGFLTGDVEDLPAADYEALRVAGLSHFVAVSGSNVALFLAGLVLVLGPIAWGPRRRAVIGLAGLAVFVVATRWEPSVIRASVMAALVLAGRLVGVALDAWTALGVAVIVLVLVSPELVTDLGFQLSVAATAGVLAGAHLFDGRRPSWAWTALGASLAAQAAVAPILLVRLGSVPSAGPLVNPVAAPIVAASTGLGAVGSLSGMTWVSALAVGLAEMVLGLAHRAAAFPELGWWGTAAAGATMAAAVRWPRTRPVIVAGVLASVVGAAIPSGPPSSPELTVLDVGQGDAILLRGPQGETVLVDGGPDPVVLAGALRRRGISRVDLMVATHRHADHTTGLAGVVTSLGVARLWHPGAPGEDEPLDRLVTVVAAGGGEVRVPPVGTRLRVGAFDIEVVGPVRKYASPNDGSIVLLVRAGATSVLLSGDIETYAQADLGPLRADVMKVPHQGAATSDPGWLSASAPAIAIISVGPNDFGHPSAEVIAVLEAAGSQVLRTDRDGDVVVRLDPGGGPLPSGP